MSEYKPTKEEVDTVYKMTSRIKRTKWDCEYALKQTNGNMLKAIEMIKSR